MTIRNLEFKGLTYWSPSREGARKQLRNGRGVLYTMFSKRPFQRLNYYIFINTPLQPHHLPTFLCATAKAKAARGQEGNKNQTGDNHRTFLTDAI
jgi:hypothetical protein